MFTNCSFARVPHSVERPSCCTFPGGHIPFFFPEPSSTQGAAFLLNMQMGIIIQAAYHTRFSQEDKRRYVLVLQHHDHVRNRRPAIRQMTSTTHSPAKAFSRWVKATDQHSAQSQTASGDHPTRLLGDSASSSGSLHDTVPGNVASAMDAA